MVASKLEELRRLRKEGKTRSLDYDEDSNKIYDECTEQEFEKIQRQRLRNEDFVVDDDGEGYIDNGEYQWGDNGSERDELNPPPAKKVLPAKNSITALFKQSKSGTAPKPKAETTVNIDAIYESLGSKPGQRIKRPAATKLGKSGLGSRFKVKSMEVTHRPILGATTPKSVHFATNSTPSRPPDTESSLTKSTVSSDVTEQQSETADAFDTKSPPESLDNSELALDVTSSVTEEALHSSEPDIASSDEAEMNIDDVEIETVSADSGLLTPFNSDDCEPFLRFFWTDYQEQNNLVLFGKTENVRSVSVLVRDVCRDLYFQPKSGFEMNDVVKELNDFYVRQSQPQWRSKKTEMCDFFNTDRSRQEYLHVLHPYNLPLPTLNGHTYKPYRGVSSKRIESFLIGRNIMGPCWLDVKVNSGAMMLAWTQISVECTPRDITKTPEPEMRTLGLPTLKALSIAIQTQPTENGGHEIIGIALDVYKNAMSKQCTSLIGSRPAGADGFPKGFKALAQQKNITVHNTEKALLEWFFDTIQVADPDVLIGHALTDLVLASVVERSLVLNVQQWSKLGRARQTHKPRDASPLEVLRLCSGRLVLDLKNPFGIEIAGAKCQEFDLDEMSKTVLNAKRSIVKSAGKKTEASSLVNSLVQLRLDADCAAQIALTSQMLRLSLELTQLAGSPWRATLRGSRSNRNDFLLMHEFTKDGVIIPEHMTSKTIKGKRGKAQYTGGLVFDPVKGLHRPCTLVMDFNSLYPSIIQEHNICFSTVNFDYEADSDTVEIEVPSSSVKEGILPRILRSLVERRKAVKSLMKQPGNTPEKLQEWDMRQRALKLTANSMYGCLGLKESRFAAQHLAKLITLKGREALARARSLAEQQGLQVLYGDTDSVMVQTNAAEYSDAVAVGFEFKDIVNKQYKCMEIDIDAVFKSLLLHTKKKYAAAQLFANGETKLEIKGLDMRRREFCDASKLISTEILNIVLAMKPEYDQLDPIATFEEILNSLQNFAEKMRSGKLKPNMFVIRKQLSKEVNAFDADSKQPHVIVAREKISRGEIIKAHDVIGYIFAKGAGPVSTDAIKQRELAIDYEYYIESQIFRPVKRLCEQLEEFDETRMCEALGLAIKQTVPTRKYKNVNAPTDPLILLHKDHSFEITNSTVTTKGCICSSCQEELSLTDVASQVNNLLRQYSVRYYQHWLECDECESKTRCVSSVSPKRCAQPRCRGSLSPLFSAASLYAQMRYMEQLFSAPGFEEVRRPISMYLDNSAYAKVRIGDLFN